MLAPRARRTERPNDVAEPFQHFVDDYLAYLYEAHPTSATLDGNHVHDDLLDDLSRTAIDTHSGALAGFARRLDAIPADALTPGRPGRAPDRPGEHRVAAVRHRARPVVGARPALLRPDPGRQPGVAGHLHLRPGDRPRPPRAVEAAPGAAARAGRPRQHQGSAGHLREDRHRHLQRGVVTFIDTDLPRAFSGLDDMHLLADLADASTEATHGPVGLRPVPRNRGAARRPRRRSASAASGSSGSCELDEGLPLLVRTPADHRRTRAGARPRKSSAPLAGKLDGGDPLEAWRKAKAHHPAPGTLIADRARAGRRAAHVPRRAAASSPCPNGDQVHVAPSPGVPALVDGQHVDARPVRDPPDRGSTYYLTDALRSWPESAAARAPARSEPARRCGASRCTRCSPATSCTSSTCARSSRRCAARPCSRRPRTSRAGRTTPSR